MLDEIKEYIKDTKSDGIVSRLKAVPIFWNEISNYSNKFNCANKAEMIYLYLNQTIPPACSCGSISKPKFVSIVLGYREFCQSNCKAASARRKETISINGSKLGLAKPEVKDKVIKTLQEKYGVDNPGKIEHHKNNMKTNNPMFLSVNKQKLKKSILEKYGNEKLSRRHWSKETEFILDNMDLLEEEWKRLGTQKFCNIHTINITTLYRYLGKYNIRKPRENASEIDIFNFLTNELDLEVKRRDKKIIYPQELDFIIEEYKIAIEYCGLYWHCEKSHKRDRHYHEKKMKLANEKGYRLITIFSDEWINGQEKVKNTLKQIFNKNNKTIYARKCQILPTSSKQANEFYEKFHNMGGNCGGSVHVGLYYDLELVGCMSFQKSPGFKRHKKLGNKGFNLVRYATSGINLPGGASKCLSYFKNNYDWDFIFTYADLRWSEGNLYKKLGFQDDGIDPPTFYYVPPDYETREHRFGHRKARYVDIFDINVMTEKEIMDILGYDRIWDCGRLRYLMVK